MNMNDHPTADQVRDLLRACDPTAGEYVLWVTTAGDVHLDRLADGQTEIDFQYTRPELKLWFRSLIAGESFLGPEGAADPWWAEDVLWALQAEWQTAKGKPGMVHQGQI